jgi:hypothetical protein
MSAIPNPPDEGKPPSQTATSSMVHRHSIRVSRPFEVVRRQIDELGERWLEDALRSAIQRGHASTPDVEMRGPFLHVRVRVGRPHVEPRTYALPIEWELKGGAIPGAVTGKLEVLEAGPEEAQVGVRMVSQVPPQEDEGRLRVEHTLEVTAQFFLNRVFWTLEALAGSTPCLDRKRMSPQPEDRAHTRR